MSEIVFSETVIGGWMSFSDGMYCSKQRRNIHTFLSGDHFKSMGQAIGSGWWNYDSLLYNHIQKFKQYSGICSFYTIVYAFYAPELDLLSEFQIIEACEMGELLKLKLGWDENGKKM